MDYKIEEGKMVQVTHGTDDVLGSIFIVINQTDDLLYTNGYSINPEKQYKIRTDWLDVIGDVPLIVPSKHFGRKI